MRKFITLAMICLTLPLLYSCGGGSSTGADAPATTTKTSGVAVDPYIVGAQFCADANDNGICDPGEMLSTLSDANGVFTFDGTVAAGTHVIMVQNGIHNGEAYNLSMSAVYGGSGQMIISPVTTMIDSGFTEQQIVDMLNHLGFTGITTDNLVTDPMSGLVDDNGAISAEKVMALRASLCSYIFLLIDGSSTSLGAMTAQQIYDNVMSDGSVYTLLKQVADTMTATLNENMIATYTSQMPSGLGLPPVAFSDVVNSAVAMTTKLASVGMANANDGTMGLSHINSYLTSVGGTVNGGVLTAAPQLGMSYYLDRVESSLSPMALSGLMSAPSGMGTVFTNAHNCASGHFSMSDTGTPVCITN